MDKQFRWDPIRYFVAVAREGSVIGAARRLGVGHATVLRNVAQLEARLGLRLFDHVRSGYRITAEGEDVLASALTMEEHAEALLRRATGRGPAPEGVLKLVVEDGSLFDPMPLLKGFRAAEPLIELALEDGQGSAEARISRLHADVAILVTNSPPEDLVGRQLTRVQLAWLASEEYLAQLPEGDPRPELCHWITWKLRSSGEIDDAWHRAALRRLTPRPRVSCRPTSTPRHWRPFVPGSA